MRSRFDEQLALLNKEMIEMGALCEEVIALASKALPGGPALLLLLAFLLRLLFCLGAHGFLRQEEAVEHPVKGHLFFPGLGVHGSERSLHPLPVLQSQVGKDPGRVRRLPGADGKALHPQKPGKGGKLCKIYPGISHG